MFCREIAYLTVFGEKQRDIYRYFDAFPREVVVKLTGLTSQLKCDTLEVLLRAGLQDTESSEMIDRSQTCFAGQGTLTQQELAEDLEYAQSVRRQNFW